MRYCPWIYFSVPDSDPPSVLPLLPRLLPFPFLPPPIFFSSLKLTFTSLSCNATTETYKLLAIELNPILTIVKVRFSRILPPHYELCSLALLAWLCYFKWQRRLSRWYYTRSSTDFKIRLSWLLEWAPCNHRSPWK